ncbi:MAG TPA: response regulator [Steroidobacteraceae bacterium]|nr:response regulator [Steroidobacteraceae bacterium]
MTSRALTCVFYVDDEPDIREVVELALGLVPGLTVRTCPSGTQALQELPLVMPDLVLLDVMMPGLDGPATFAKMREDERLRSLPVIFMTAKALPQEIDRFMQLGAVGVISKPFDPVQLGVRVQELWSTLP